MYVFYLIKAFNMADSNLLYNYTLVDRHETITPAIKVSQKDENTETHKTNNDNSSILLNTLYDDPIPSTSIGHI